MFREVADIQTADMLNLPIPAIQGGKVQNITLKPTEWQQKMVKGLSERADKVRNRQVPPQIDNMLKITTDGRALALDQRLQNPMLPDDPDSKVAACVEKTHKIWREGTGRKLTQLIFCDLSTPGGKPIETVLVDGVYTPIETLFSNIYQDLKEKLMARGIPAEEIAFIHDANTEKKKDALFAKVRAGTVRILIGSTAKMGAGTNVQKRLKALHHLDVPWRPRDLEQREGRILRQGNENEEVEIYRYITEGTFDAYSYQLVESKQKFISQIMTSKSPARSAEDIDEVALSYAEVKALAAGSPLIKEKMDLDIEVARLKLLKQAHVNQRYRYEGMVTYTYPAHISELTSRIQGLELDIARRDGQATEVFFMRVLEMPYDKREDAGLALVAICKQIQDEEPVSAGCYRGFEMAIRFDATFKRFQLTLQGALKHTAELGADGVGNTMRLDNLLEGMDEELQRGRADLQSVEQQMTIAREESGKPFAQEQELRDKLLRQAELDSLLRVDAKAPVVELEEKQQTKPVGRRKEPER